MPAPDYGQGEQTLTRAAALVAEARAELDGISARLVGSAESLRAQWGGQGAAAFQVLASSWHRQQQAIVGALDRFEQSLVATEKDNVATDDAQQAAMTALQGSLGTLPGTRL